MEFKYRIGIENIIYAMSTCHPDMPYAASCTSQHSVCPHKIPYKGVKHMLTYMYMT